MHFSDDNVKGCVEGNLLGTKEITFKADQTPDHNKKLNSGKVGEEIQKLARGYAAIIQT